MGTPARTFVDQLQPDEFHRSSMEIWYVIYSICPRVNRFHPVNHLGNDVLQTLQESQPSGLVKDELFLILCVMMKKPPVGRRKNIDNCQGGIS